MKTTSWMMLALAVMATGCSKELVPDSGGGGDNGTGEIDGTDDDDDTSEEGSSPVEPDIVDCRSDYDTPLPGSAQNGGECTTDELRCGDFIQATTVGGSTHYDTAEYLAALIATNSENWDAPERAYTLRQPIGQAIRVTFYSPCADIDIAVCLGWECAETNEIRAGDCSALLEGDDNVYQRIFRATSAGVREFEVIVDGRDGDVGNFAIEVECFDD